MATETMLKTIVATVCAYEAVAIWSSGKLPMVTTLVHRHPVLGEVVLIGLRRHFRPRGV